MATSSIRRNFVIEGRDAVDFANSLDDAFKEKKMREPYRFDGEVFEGDEAVKVMKEFFSK